MQIKNIENVIEDLLYQGLLSISHEELLTFGITRDIIELDSKTV